MAELGRELEYSEEEVEDRGYNDAERDEREEDDFSPPSLPFHGSQDSIPGDNVRSERERCESPSATGGPSASALHSNGSQSQSHSQSPSHGGIPTTSSQSPPPQLSQTPSGRPRPPEEALDSMGADSSDLLDGRKKKRSQRNLSGDKGGKGLRHFSIKVCEKVKSKGRTTYNEVADELVAEFENKESDHPLQYDEKNIRRRVYDALNVLMAMDIIAKEKKEIHWRGLPTLQQPSREHFQLEALTLRSEIEKKEAHLRELQEQISGIELLAQRNEAACMAGTHGPGGGVALPFIIVQTQPQATVEVMISEDMQVVHFDFNSSPFQLHDDTYVLRAMGLFQRSEGGETGTVPSPTKPLFLPSMPHTSQELARYSNIPLGGPSLDEKTYEKRFPPTSVVKVEQHH